jgi:predicted adenylyl cyclase CyaB
MALNIEVKARSIDPQRLLSRVVALKPHHLEVIQQDDTFFHCSSGRLKLRDFGNGEGELIYYERPDQAGPKTSFYVRTPTQDPEGLRKALTLALGQLGRVRKSRMLYLVGRTRIHVDDVEGLGHFVELEVVLNDEDTLASGEAQARDLMQALGIADEHLLEGAYLDLMPKPDLPQTS